VNYDDGLIACSDTELVIRRYTLLLRPRRIPYGSIRSVARIRLNALRRSRLWGGDLRQWFNFDLSRPRKDVAFVIDLGEHVKPVVTPDDPHRFADALRGHGVVVDRGA
jgi:hypothetical protein